MTTTDASAASAIETQPCPRCGGGGAYSFCQMHGSRCFKCGGRGVVFTARGAEANRYLERLRSKLMSEVIVGDVVWFDGCGVAVSGWFRVESIHRSTDATVAKTECVVLDGARVNTGDRIRHGDYADKPIRVAQSAEEKARTLAEALAYQASLTKSGKPAKSASTRSR